MQNLINQSNELKGLRAIFVAAGFDLWFVGGCVRDTLMGKEPKDIDLATSATPDEQVAIYEANNMRFIPTGLQHGTVSVVLDQTYEITSLRTEADHDGRHATMSYTRDLAEDLSRRDLTINAMALDFDGILIDPFGGQSDLANRRVRFVGDAVERMREDYLRILRFFRFHARIAGDGPLCEDAASAIRTTRAGLEQISVERVWMEMSKIITGPSATSTVSHMRDLRVLEVIGMPEGFPGAFGHAAARGITDPATVMAWYLIGPVDALAKKWKWSSAERARAQFIAANVRPPHRHTVDQARFKVMLVDGVPFEWVADLMALNDVPPASLADWNVPSLPVTGRDLIEAGVKPGPDMGAVLKAMREDWIASDYSMTRDDLMSNI